MLFRNHRAEFAAALLALLPVASALKGGQSVRRTGDDPEDEVKRPPHDWYCEWRGRFREDICYWMPKEGPFFNKPSVYRRYRKGILNMTALKRDVWVAMRFEPALRDEFFEEWEKIMTLQGADVFAFKQTWLHSDAHGIDKEEPDGWWEPGPGDNRPPEAMKDFDGTLPDISHYLNLIEGGGSLAIVGGSNKLDMLQLGEEIDSHAHVVRFNDDFDTTTKFVKRRPKLKSSATGSKTTIHVVNSKRRGGDGSGSIPIVDLGMENILQSYCQRFYHDGEFLHSPGEIVYITRPTRWCMLGKGITKFSESFLFYWFVGSMMPEVSLYGVMDKSPKSRYNANEFAWAEGKVYEAIAKQWQADVKTTQLARTQLRVGGKSGLRVVS